MCYYIIISQTLISSSSSERDEWLFFFRLKLVSYQNFSFTCISLCEADEFWFLFSVEFPVSLSTSWIYRREWWSLQFSRLFWWSEKSVHQLRDKLEDFCKEDSRRSQTEVSPVDSSALRNQSIIISYHGEHHIRNVLVMDAGSWESHCSCLLISTVTFTTLFPAPGTTSYNVSLY